MTGEEAEMSGKQIWQAGLYDEKLRYVAEYGKGVVELLSPKPGERILDLGCGTGDLTHEISKSGAEVLGMDLAEPMIHQARNKYPHLSFKVGNAEHFELESPVDAVFSNAALHWMKDGRGGSLFGLERLEARRTIRCRIWGKRKCSCDCPKLGDDPGTRLRNRRRIA